MSKCLCGHFESCKACNPFKKTKQRKREKPKRGRPWLIARETKFCFYLYIFYPNGKAEWMRDFSDQWRDYKQSYAETTEEFRGWKTHFLGNL